MPIRRLVLNFQSTITVCAYDDTQMLLHMHIRTLTCRQMQAFNRPFVTRTYTRMHMHIHTTHPHIDKAAFGEGYGKAWYYVLDRHTSGHTGIHMLGPTIRVCEGERPGEGDNVVSMQQHTQSHVHVCVVEMCRSRLVGFSNSDCML